MNDWQPIDTAPKDGTEILVYRPAKNPFKERTWISRWLDRSTVEFGRVTHELKEWDEGNLWGHFHMDPPKPTHWMPVPSAPSQENQP